MSALSTVDGRDVPPRTRRVSRVRSAYRAARRANVPVIPLGIITLLVIAGIVGPSLAAHDPYAFSLIDRLASPSGEHLLGTDALGRDLLSRLLLGARTTLLVVAVSIALGGALGLILGVVAGYFGGVVDAVISRLTDATLAFPTLLFGLLFAVSVGPGFGSVVAAISLSLWAEFVRVVRAEVLSLREREFVQQAKVYGSSAPRLLAVHVLPNVFNSFVVLLGVNLGKVILSEASLSYLGAGIPQPTPSWGNMVAEGQQYIGSAWWISIIPGLAISLTVLALFLIGDWMRDYLDPRLRQRAPETIAGPTL
jgi:peptide/nickel transport system permease protein